MVVNFQMAPDPDKAKAIENFVALQLMTFTYFLNVKDSNRDHLNRLNVVISQIVTGRANIAIANTGRCYLPFDCYIYNGP